MNRYEIRTATLSDAESLTQFVIQLDKESDYLLFGPNERKINVSATHDYLQKIADVKQSAVYVAVSDEQPILGFICGEAFNIKRISHVMKVNIGILQKYRGTKLARELADILIENARKSAILRLEATVIKENKISLNLCRKFGFEIEGLKKAAIKIGDVLHDEYQLAKYLY